MLRSKSPANLNREEFTRLYEIGRVINSSLDLQKVVQIILRRGAELIGAVHGSLSLVDGDDLSIRSWIGTGWINKRRDQRLKIGKGITGVVAKTGKPYVCNDTSDDPNYFPLFPNIRSELAIPLRSRGRVIGVLNFDSPKVDAFTPHHKDLLSILAEQATTALENARLHGTTSDRLVRKVKDLEALHEVAATVSASLNPQKTLKLVLDKACELTGARYGNILLKVQDKDEIEIVVDKGSTEEKKRARQTLGEGVTGTVAMEKRARLIPDVTQPPHDKLYMGFIPGMRSELAVPMLKGDDLIGIINVESPKVNAFDAGDQNLLESFAHIAVVAIDNAHLFERTDKQLERKISEIETLRKIELVISSELNISNALKSILEEGLQLMRSRHPNSRFYGHIQMIDKSDGSLVLRATAGVPKSALGLRVKIGKGEKGLTGIVAISKEPLLVNDLSQRPWADMYVQIIPKMRSELVVPLLDKEQRLVGVFNVESPATNAFDDDDKELLRSLGRQAVIAIRNAERYETLKMTYETVRRIASTLDIEQVLGFLVESGIKRTGAHSGSARLLSADEPVLVAFVRRGKTGERSWEPIRFGEGIVGACAAQKQFIRVPDVEKDRRYIRVNPDTRSELAVPLLKGDVLFGVLNFEHPLREAFDEEDVQCIRGLADQAAVVIDIKNNVDQREAAREQVAASNAIGWLGILGATWQHEVKKLVHSIEVGIKNLKATPLALESLTILKEIDGYVAAAKKVAPELPSESEGEAVGLGTVIHAALAHTKLASGIKVDQDIGDQLPAVCGTAKWLTIVFQVLFQNSKDSMKGKGKLSVHASRRGSGVVVDVSDNGPGVPEAIARRLFREWIKESSGGGFGLLLAKTVLVHFGGDIKLVDPGPGTTTFRLRLQILDP